MQVIKITSEGLLEWELYNLFNKKNYITISYAPQNQHASGHEFYQVDSNLYSVQELIAQLPVWACREQKDNVAIYTNNTDEINNELISNLQKLNLIHPTGLNNHEFYFSCAHVICESVKYATIA